MLSLFYVHGGSSFLMECSEKEKSRAECIVSIILGPASVAGYSLCVILRPRSGKRSLISRNCEAATKLRNEDINVAVAYRPNDPMPASMPVISVSISRLCVSESAPRDAQRVDR